AIARDQLAPDFLGEILGGEQVGAAAPGRHAERAGLGFFRLFGRDVAVLVHLVYHPVAALDRTFGVAEWMIVGWPARERRQVGGFRYRQFVDRLVEIGERRPRDAVGAESEEDLVEVEFQDAVLGIGPLDPERQQ